MEYELKYHQIEENYWWFEAQRDMVFGLVQGLHLNREAAILEIGCSGGLLLQRLYDTGYAQLTRIAVSLFFPTAAVRLLKRILSKVDKPAKDDFFATPPLLNTLLSSFIWARDLFLRQ